MPSDKITTLTPLTPEASSSRLQSDAEVLPSASSPTSLRKSSRVAKRASSALASAPPARKTRRKADGYASAIEMHLLPIQHRSNQTGEESALAKKKSPNTKRRGSKGKEKASRAVAREVEREFEWAESEGPFLSGQTAREACTFPSMEDAQHAEGLSDRMPFQVRTTQSQSTQDRTPGDTVLAASGDDQRSSTPGLQSQQRSTPEFNLEQFISGFTSNLPDRAPEPNTAATLSTSGLQGQSISACDELNRLQAAYLAERQRIIDRLETHGQARQTVPPPLPTLHDNSAWQADTAQLPTLPPPAIAQLKYSSFVDIAGRKVKGEYTPPEAHLLTAYRLYRPLTEAGTSLSAMQLLLIFREHPSAKFLVTPAVLMALFSGRLGCRGLTIMHFVPLGVHQSLLRGSTNENFMDEFGKSAQLPVVDACCDNYEHLLRALNGLRAFASAFWFDHGLVLLDQLKSFITTNQNEDTSPPLRLQYALMYANRFLGQALGCLASDAPSWWDEYCTAIRAVDCAGKEWTSALTSLALSLRVPSTPETPAHSPTPLRYSRGPSRRTPIIPDHLRAMIPHDSHGKKPCLKYFGGSMCLGGTTKKCANADRTHIWDHKLPRELHQWAVRTYGHQRYEHQHISRRHERGQRQGAQNETKEKQEPGTRERDSRRNRSSSSRRH